MDSRRRGIYAFAIFVVLAQVGLLVFLRARNRVEPTSTAAAQPPAPGASPAPATPASIAGAGKVEENTAPAPAPEPPRPATPADTQVSIEPPKAEPPPAVEEEPSRPERRATRTREVRPKNDDRNEREQQRRFEEERQKASAEAEKERTRLEVEKAELERARLEAEKQRLELEKARLAAEARGRSASTPAPAVAAPPRVAIPKRTGSPDVLIVLVNPSVGMTLSRDDIRNVYYGRTTIWPNGRAARAYNRPAGSAAGRKFFGAVLRTSSSDFRDHWSAIQLSGGGIAPGTITSAEAMVARVAASAGAIGYVLESELPADLHGLRAIRLK